MPDPLRTKQYRIVEVHVSFAAVAERFSSVENKGEIQLKLLDASLEFQQLREIVRQWLERILVSDKIKAYVGVREPTTTSTLQNLPAIRWGNSCLSSMQSLQYHCSSSGVTMRTVV